MGRTKQINIDENIIDVALDEVMHDSFMTYAEYVAMERALPRVEDGLKPVQRRILYTLNELGITPDKPYKKSARVVGETLGKFHPHGDTSVYEAMVRLAQQHVMRMPLVDGHGNFGSMDGDSAAAMRYTEVRMSPLALEMLRDLNKDTVLFRPNFDDTEQEPDVLPARYPNLLVNGTSGIAVAMGTSIPPHNLGEVISGVLYRIDHPDCALKDIMKHIKGPDFPTGGYLLAGVDLIKGYETGKGKVYIRAKTHFEKLKNGKTNIVITEIPYDVKKSALLEQILSVSESKKDLFNSIDDIRDESDREGIRAVIEIKKGADADKILHLLYKYTNMQITFRIDMMAIADDRPKLLSLIGILDKYIEHQKNVIIRRTQYDLEKAEKREHILKGLIIAVENIDRVIALIRHAKNLSEAKKGLMKELLLTGVQAQAILDMRLARLNRLEVASLENEYKEVTAQIQYFKSILESEDKLLKVVKQELSAIKKKYGDERRTEILNEEDAIVNVDESQLIQAEECIIVITNSGNLKRTSPKFFQKSVDINGIDEKNRPAQLIKTDTAQKLCIFTSSANMYTVTASQIPEGKIKDAGKPLTAIINGVDNSEHIIKIFTQQQIERQNYAVFFTELGMVKLAETQDFIVKKTRILSCGLKDDDRLINIELSDDNANDLLLVTKDGMSIKFSKEEVPVMGRTAKGVAAVKLGSEDKIILGSQHIDSDTAILLITDKGYAKKVPAKDFALQGRNGKGVKAFKLTENTGEILSFGFIIKEDLKLSILQKSGKISECSTEHIPIESKSGSGKHIVLCVNDDIIENVYINVLGN